MADLNGYDANDYEPDDFLKNFEPIAAGKYPMAITASEIKPTKNGDGSYLELELTVVEGEFEGRKVWDRLCINHPKELTQTIARGKLSSICRAVGVMSPGDSAELHNIPLLVKVKLKKRDDTDEMTNEVSYYSPIEKQTAPANQAAGQTPKQSAGGNSDTPPWSRS
ncbi:MAG TPA: DUF669 domain-containing protein [Phycisphaerae bacterium]|nr:DUF669 domain-containing protein [Phycisphaerae bacterium]